MNILTSHHQNAAFISPSNVKLLSSLIAPISSLLNQTGIEVTDQERVTALNVPIARIRQHGTYQCRASEITVYSETGSLNVTGKIIITCFCTYTGRMGLKYTCHI